MEQFPAQADNSVQSFLAVGAREPTITIDPSDVRISGPKPPTLVGRIATRMVFGVVALSLFEAVVWMGQKYPSAGASAEALASPEADVAIAAAYSKPFEPSWFSAEMFSATIADPSSSAPPLADVPMPKPRPSPR
jgi:hypothetical protein